MVMHNVEQISEAKEVGIPVALLLFCCCIKDNWLNLYSLALVLAS